MDILKGFIDIVSNPIKAVGDAVDGAVRNLADDEARRQAEEEERRRREEEERKRREEEKRRAEEEERARRAEEVRRQQEQAEKQKQELQRQANELNNNRQNMSDEEYSMKRQELTLKDNGFNDLQSKLDAEKYGNSKVSDILKINGEGEEGRHQFNIGKITHKILNGADAENLSIEQMAKRWGELNGNDQQDIASNLKTLQYRYTQEGKEQEALSTARLLGDLERYGGKAKDRDFINSLVTNAKHGGFAGDIASNIEQTLGNVTGQGEKFREILNARQNDMDSLDGWNKAGNTIGNIVFDTGANLVSGGAKMALDTGMGAINVGEKALDEKTLDENGKIRNHNLEEQAGLIGSELVTDGLRLAGAKGLTPSLDKVADLMRSGSGIKQILPEVAKYGAKELGTVLPTSYLQTNLNVMGNGGHFGEAKLEDIAKDTAMNIGTDLAMDIRSGLGRARTGGDVKQLYHDGKLLPNTGLTPNAGRNARMAEAIDNYPISEPFNYGRLSREQVARHNTLNDGLNPLQTRDLTVNPQQFSPHIEKRISQGVDPKDLTKITENAIYGDNSQILSGTTNPLNRRYVNADNPSSVAIIGNDNGETTLRSFYPRKTDNIKSDIAKDTAVNSQNMATHLQEMGAINNIPQNSNDVKNLKIEDGEINNFIKDQVKKQNSQNKVPLKEKLADNVANLKHYLIDDAVAYERYTKDKALKKELREGIDRVRSSETIASQFIRDTGLSEALGKMSKQEQNEFGQYLIAKRHLEVADRDIATGRDLAVDKVIVDKFGEKYSQAEEVYRNHNKAMLEHMAEHGLISNELKDKLIAENPNYAPLQRIMDEAENFSGNSKQLGNLSNQSVVKGLKGSERVVDNPLEATLNNTFRMINEVERNKVARSLAENVFGNKEVENIPEWLKRESIDRDGYSPKNKPAYKIHDSPEGKYVEIEKDILEGVDSKDKPKVIREYIRNNFTGKDFGLNDGADGAAIFTGRTARKMSQKDFAIDNRGKMINDLPDILKISKKSGEAIDTKNHSFAKDGFEYREAKVKVGDEFYNIQLNIGKNPNGKVFYTINNIEKLPAQLNARTSEGYVVGNLSVDILPQKQGIVKGLRLGDTEKLAYLDNGKKVEIEVPKLVAKEMKNLNGVLPDGLDKVISVLAMPARTLRAGATGLNPIFVASNLVRDQIQSAVSGGVISSLKGTPKALLATFGRGEKANALKAELARAGLGGSEYRMTYGGNKGELLKQLQAEHKWTNGTIEKLRHPINTLADIIGITENFTRAQQYFGTNGDELAKAQASRNNTLNFSRGGSVVKVLNKIIPFLNAGVQGGRQTVNLVKERPVHTGVATAVIGGVILAADVINKSDERRKELWDRVSDSDKKTNIIAFTPDAHYNPETNRIEGLIKIPMPQIFYPLLDLQNAKGTIPEKGLKIASDIFTAVSGIDVDNPISQLTPTAVKPMLEQFTNKNFFTGRELVSDYDKNKRPDEKGAKYSSGIARGIANLTGIDAPMVDNYITGFTGSLGGDMAKTLTDNPDNAKDGKGIGDYINNGIYRRFLSTNITSQNQIAEDKAKKAKDALNNDPTFKNMSREDQVKVLNAIDNDFSKIASTLAKKEQNHEDEIKKDLNDRQKALMDGNFEAGKYAEAMQAGKEGGGSDNKYGKKDNKKVFYKQADAEYEDFKKEFAEKSEKGEYSRLQKIEAEHKLKRLELTKDYDKDVRDSYGASRTNLYKLYGMLSGEEKENLKGKLNGINDIMLKNGEISQKEYDSKYKIINEIESVKGGNGGRGQKGGVGYVKGLKVEAGKLPEFKMENAPKIKGSESKLKTTGIVKGLTLNSKANKEGQVGLKRVRVTIK